MTICRARGSDVLDVRTAQDELENLVRDAVLLALGRRLAAVGSVAELRGVPTMGASGSARTDDDLICVVSGGAVVTAFRWSSLSTSADDDATVIVPSDAGNRGRWVAYTSQIEVSLTPGAQTQYLHQVQSGPLARVILLDKDMSKDDIAELLQGAVPAVAIEPNDDEPADMTLNVGERWDTSFTFTVYVIAENLRGRRQAAQGSLVTGETSWGANAVDGLLQALLAGTQLTVVEDGIRSVQVGRGNNWVSDLGQRRVIRSRVFTVRATVCNTPGAGDSATFTDAETQPQMAAPDSAADLFDPENYLFSGMSVAVGAGLSQAVSAGSAVVAGATVAYAGGPYNFEAWADTYRDLASNGTMTFTAVPNGSPAPALASGSLRVGVTETDGDSVVSDVTLAATLANYGAAMDIQA